MGRRHVRKGEGVIHPDEASVYSAEKRAGVYDDDPCINCYDYPCSCGDEDRLYERYKERVLYGMVEVFG